MKRVTLYGRPECHLCDQAREGIAGLRSEGRQFELHDVNIELDRELHAAYLERIPVVAVDGVEISELRVDLDAVRASLDTVPA